MLHDKGNIFLLRRLHQWWATKLSPFLYFIAVWAVVLWLTVFDSVHLYAFLVTPVTLDSLLKLVLVMKCIKICRAKRHVGYCYCKMFILGICEHPPAEMCTCFKVLILLTQQSFWDLWAVRKQIMERNEICSTLRLLFCSFFLIQLSACCCGSMHMAKRLPLLVRIPFCTESSSGGKPSEPHLSQRVD